MSSESKVDWDRLGGELARKQHLEFIQNLDKDKDVSFEYAATEHLRMSGAYWGLAAASLLLGPKLASGAAGIDPDKVVAFVNACWDPATGGYAGNVGHDPHLLYTLSAVQILAILGRMDQVDAVKVVQYVKSLQQPDGSFFGDCWGEVDTRFSYCALSCAKLLGKLDELNVDKAVEFVLKCSNFDGGFGSCPDAETHAGQSALAIAGRLDRADRDLLGWWLAERQLPCGGLNGRPEKKEDVCYSWWVLSSLSMLGRLEWIDSTKLAEFILSCQDRESGGISDRADNVADVFHTFFGIAGLSLLGFPDLEPINPVYALPDYVVKNLGI